MTNIDESDEKLLEELLAKYGTLQNISDRLNHIEKERECRENIELLEQYEFPMPEGKLKPYFIAILNFFITASRRSGLPKDLLKKCDYNEVTANVASMMEVGIRTVREKFEHLTSLGWVEHRYGYMDNPIWTYKTCLDEGRWHPALSQNQNPKPSDRNNCK